MRLRRREEPSGPEVSVEALPRPEVDRRPMPPPQPPPPQVVRSMATPAERAAARRRLDRLADEF